MKKLAIVAIVAGGIGTAHGAWWDLKPSSAPTTSSTPAATPVAPSGQKATLADLQQLVQDQKYQAGLQAAAWLLGDEHSADRYEVLMLKAQCLLGTKSADLAVSTYETAVKATKDGKKSAKATACGELVGHSPAFLYTPKFSMAGGSAAAETPNAIDTVVDGVKGKQNNTEEKKPSNAFKISFAPLPRGTAPIGIVEADSRDKALAAFYVDQLAAALPGLKEAESGESVPALLSAIRTLEHLRVLEIAAGETDTQIAAMRKALATRADKLMADVVSRMSKQQTEILRRAESRNANRVRQGLDSDGANALREIIGMAEDISAACKDFSQLPEMDSKAFNNTNTEAQRIVRRAKAALGI
jgi:hypothetical protein